MWPNLTNCFLFLILNSSISNMSWDYHLWWCAKRIRIQVEVLLSYLSKLSPPVALDILPGHLAWNVSYESDCLCPVDSERSHCTGCIGTQRNLVHLSCIFKPTWDSPSWSVSIWFLYPNMKPSLKTVIPWLVSLISRSSMKFPIQASPVRIVKIMIKVSVLTQIQNTLHVLKLSQVIIHKYFKSFFYSDNTSS